MLCTLESSLTPAEATLMRMGEHQPLRDIRMFFQHSSETEFRGAAEKIIGRKVRAFVSGIDVEQDLSSELFYLEPGGSDDGPAEDGRNEHEEAPSAGPDA